MTWLSDIPEVTRAYLEDKRLDEGECVIADLPGIARGKAVPAIKWERQKSFFLPNSIFFQTITGDWGEAAGPEGFTEPDMILRPDLSTAAVEGATEETFDRLGIRHLAFHRLNALSGGQRQMVGLAQVVVRKPAE